MIRAIDHIVILVADLDSATADYTALGFTVTPGGTHADGATHNVLVVFGDDSYLELIAFRREAPEHHWWRHVAAGEGLIDFALLPSSIAEDVAAAQSRGLDIYGPHSGGRLRPDGVRVEWQTALPTTPDMPFLCGDVTPRELRVPQGELRTHPNGVSGIAGVTVVANDLWASAARYQALLGSETAGPAFALGAASITLIAPIPGAGEQDPLRARLNRRGEGPFALTLRGERATAFDPALTHGVPIDLVAMS
jgi:catechol 2,3-dioxygenase-like lactoylglutathione lyase family enzyme